MEAEDEKPKVSKTEEKESFLKELDKRIEENKKIVEEMRSITERNEELTARGMLGGKTDAGIQPVKPVEESAVEYAKRILSGKQ